MIESTSTTKDDMRDTLNSNFGGESETNTTMADFKDKLANYKSRDHKKVKKDRLREKDLMDVLVEVTAVGEGNLRPRR